MKLNFRLRMPLLATLATLMLAACSKKDSKPPNPNPGPGPVITPPPDFGYKVVGYFPSYRNPATTPDAKFRMTNVVNYAFFTVTNSSGLTLNSPSTFAAVVAKAKANNAKVFMSINGSTTDFSASTLTAAARNTLIKTIMNNVRQYQLNGVDMDWEFPSTADNTHTQFTALMKELSDSCHLDGKYYLTAAITPGKYAGSYRDAIETVVFGYVDWFNVMVYDDFSTTTPYRHHADMNFTNVSLNYWLNTRAMPSSKFVLGLPGYGRPSGITQTGTIFTYSGILGQGGSPLSDSAVVTAGAYPTPYTVYYNGLPTIKRKAITARQRGAGVMLWEKGQDANDNNSLLKAVCDTVGRSY